MFQITINNMKKVNKYDKIESVMNKYQFCFNFNLLK